MFVHFIIYNIECIPPKIIKCGVKINVFLFLWDLKIQKKMYFIVLRVINLALKSFEYFGKKVCASPALNASSYFMLTQLYSAL